MYYPSLGPYTGPYRILVGSHPSNPSSIGFLIEIFVKEKELSLGFYTETLHQIAEETGIPLEFLS